MDESTVWVIETGDYELRYVFGVAKDLNLAVKYIKEQFPAPYVVAWSKVNVDDADSVFMIGEFEAVAGTSTKHVACFDFTKMVLH